ncbi:MAG: hypothetical protein ACOC1E_01725 [Marinilabiliaceae bacterium]
MKKFIFPILCLFFVASLSAQSPEPSDSVSVEDETDTQERITDKEKLVWVSLYAGGGPFQWNHSVDEVTFDQAIAFEGGFVLNFRIVDWLEVSTGAGLSALSSEATVDTYDATMDAVDSEGDEYEKRVSVSGVVEKQEYLWAKFPLSVRYVFNPGRWDIYAEAGAEYRMAIKSSFEQSGDYSNHGYYSKYDLLIDDLPEYGFYDDRTISSEGDLDMDGLLQPFAGVGVVFPGKMSHFFIEARYYLPGNDPFSEKQDLLFQGPSDEEGIAFYEYKSLMRGGDVSLSGFTGVIGIRF